MTVPDDVKNRVSTATTEQLKSLNFSVQLLPQMPHQVLGSIQMDQKAIDADTLRWSIQRELDSRHAGELPYGWGEMYMAMGIPKEFLR